MSSKTLPMPLQTATTEEYKFVISNWLREHVQLESADIIDEVCKWPEPARICSIQNLWRGQTESRYGTFLIYNSFSGRANKQAGIGTEQQKWKQIPITGENSNVFYLQHLQSKQYLCFASNHSSKIELYNDREIKQNQLVRIKCARFEIEQKDARFVYDQSKIKSTFYWRNAENMQHIAFTGTGVCFYDRHNTNDLVPWLTDYVDDTESQNEQIKEQKLDLVRRWLEKLNVSEYLSNFVDNGYDRMELILEMNEQELKHIGISKMGHLRLLNNSIVSLRQNAIREYVQYLDVNDI